MDAKAAICEEVKIFVMEGIYSLHLHCLGIVRSTDDDATEMQYAGRYR